MRFSSMLNVNPRIPGITNISFTGPIIREGVPDGPEIIRSVNAVVVSPGRRDRSPCGTGTSARLALQTLGTGVLT